MTDLPPIKGLQELPCFVESAVYILCRGTEIYYIGQSTNFLGRISQHFIHRRGQFDKVHYIPWPAADLDRLEGALIRHFQPPGNACIKGQMVAPFETYPDDIVLHELGIDPQSFFAPATFDA